nr:alpha/beta hydrolase [Clostridia bacterium]
MGKILVHGLGQTPHSWDNVISALGSTDVHCPDLIGLISGDRAEYSRLYENFVGYCDNICGKHTLCGLSLGGILALNYAADRPEKIERLVLIAAQYRMPKTLLRFQNAVFRIMPNKAFDGMEFTKQEMISLCSSTAQLDFTDRLAAVRCPTIIVIGEHDRPNRKAAHELSRLIPNAELCIVRGAGHEVNADAPDYIAEILSNI